MIDINKIYVFHNIYGDAQGLIDTAPENVEFIPFGWTEEIENNRNQLMQELGVGISVLPTAVAWSNNRKSIFKIKNPNTNLIETITHDLEPGWETISVGLWNTEDWTWQKINKELEKF